MAEEIDQELPVVLSRGEKLVKDYGEIRLRPGCSFVLVLLALGLLGAGNFLYPVLLLGIYLVYRILFGWIRSERVILTNRRFIVHIHRKSRFRESRRIREIPLEGIVGGAAIAEKTPLGDRGGVALLLRHGERFEVWEGARIRGILGILRALSIWIANFGRGIGVPQAAQDIFRDILEAKEMG